MVSSANHLLQDLDLLNEDTTSACVEVEYCIQNLNLISTKQFMEKRVYDEEVSEKKEETITQTQTAIAAIDFVPKIKEAIRVGLPTIKLQVENFAYAANGNPQSLGRGSNSLYSIRSLPYLLGTEEFIDSPTVGVSEGGPFKCESTSNHQPPNHPSNSTSSSVPSSPSLKSNLPVPVLVDNRQHSDSDVSSMSEAGGRLSDERKEIDETLKRPGLSNLQDVISARLKDSSDPIVRPSFQAYTTPYVKVPVKDESQHQEVKENNSRRAKAAPQLKSEIVSSREIIQPPKKKTLFDDSSSESDGELFRSNASKVATPSSSALNSTTSSASRGSVAPQLPVSKTNNPLARSSNLFGSSDSEDDLFSGAITSNPKSSKSTENMGASASDDEENIFSSKDATKKNSQSAPSIKVVLPADKLQSLFDDVDVPDFVRTNPNLPANVAVPTVNKPQDKSAGQQAKQSGLDQPKQRSLFADSDESDEDLFRNIVAVKNKVPALVVPPTTLSTSPLPDKIVTQSSRHQSTPIQNGDKKVEENKPASSTENSAEPVRVETHSKVKSKPSLLFDDDSDDEDLFKGVSVTKYSPPKTTPQSVQNVSKGDSVKDVPPPKPPVPVAEAIGNLDDDLFSPILRSKLSPLSGTSTVARKLEGPLDGSSVAIVKATEKSISPARKLLATAVSVGNLTAKPVAVSSNLSEALPTNTSNNLFGSQNAPTVRPHQRQQILDAFEDPDDGDLFGISSSKQVSPPVTKSSKIEDTKSLMNIPHDTALSSKVPEEMEASQSDISQSLETQVVPETSTNTANKISGRIASLKLSLAMQPNSLPFSNTESMARTPNDEDSNTTSNVIARKPFGGAPLFGPRIPSPVKSLPPSPTKTEQKIISRDAENENNAESGQNGDFLDCVNRQRPKAPNRRLPSRNFRRSKIQDDEEESSVPQVMLALLAIAFILLS